MKSVRALSHLERNERCSNLRLFLYAKPFYKRYIDFVQNKEQWVCVENSNFLIIDIHQFPSELKAKSTSTVVNIFECLCLCSYTNFLRRINYILYIFVIINQSKKYNTHYSEFSFYLIDIYLTVSNNKYCERSVNVLLIGANIFSIIFIYYQICSRLFRIFITQS